MTATLSTRYRATQLADKLRHRLMAEKLVDGEFFMTEAQLAQEYGVSRSTAREAVSRLRELGILEGRKNKGLVVRRPNPVHLFSRSLPAMATSEQDIHELARLRYVLEVGAIELAVIYSSDDQIERLQQLAEEFEQAVNCQAETARQNELELSFHGLILQMTHSPLIAGMQEVLATFFARDSVPGDQQSAWQHHAIVAAIRARDVERARSMIRLHFEDEIYVNHRLMADRKLPAKSGESE